MTTLVSVVAAVAEAKGRYLICRRPEHKRHGGLWEFPGGKVEPGESFKEAVCRELEEELGVRDAEVGHLLASIEDEQSNFVIHFIATNIADKPIALEHEEIAWRTTDQLLQMNLAPSDQIFATKVLNDDCK